MKINYKLHNNMLFVKIGGEVDECSAEYLRRNLDEIFTDHDMEKVIFDLSGVDFMDSTGIGLMIGRYKQLKNRRIPAYVLNPSMCVDKIFTMTKIYDVMPKIMES